MPRPQRGLGYPAAAGRAAAAEAVPGDEDAGRVGGRMPAQQADGGGRLRHVLVGQREGPAGGDAFSVRAGDLLEPQDGDPGAGQAPGQVLERLVPPDGLVAVLRAGAGQQHHRGRWPALAGQAQRSGNGPTGPSPTVTSSSVNLSGLA
ncbi:MAG: hypothetical protein ACLP7J_00435 [Streptosporangiaceae bacterium]